MEACILCKSSQKDDLQYGDFLKNEHFGVHTFCLYLSSNLSQRGEDDEGILGFLEEDIRKEVKRVSLLKCCYCSKMYANIGCCNKKCRRTFHLICGIEHGAQNQFSHEFQSYCRMHTKEETQRPSSNETCLICYERLCAAGKGYDKVNMILTPCCRNGWFHKLCLQKSAKVAGYFFKCPLCNDTKTFREKLPAKGIYIPNCDAAWELEPNAFAELLERPNECAAPRCKHNQGRKASNHNNPFVMCSTCGSTAMHKKCLPSGAEQFHCNDCTVALEESDSGHDSFNLRVNHNDTEGEYVDVCHVSDKEDLEIVERLIARDSGIQETNANSNHEELFPSTRRCNKTKKIGERSEKSTQKRMSTTDSDSSPLTYPLRNRRIRSDSESSKDTLENENIPRVARCIKRKIKIGRKSSEDTSADENLPQALRSRKTRVRVNQKEELPNGSKCRKNTENTLEVKEIPSSSKNNDATRLKRKSESSETDELQKPKLRKRNHFKFFDDSDDSEIINNFQLVSKNNKPETNTATSKNSLRSSEEEVVSPSKKRMDLNDVNNTGVDVCDARKEMRDESDSDDPLDNISFSCSNSNMNKSQDLTKKVNSGHVCESQGKERTKRSKFVPLKSAPNSGAKYNNLDISCVAKRTRRKTISGNSNNIKNEKKENPLNISCIAVRTRRKTICAQTNYSKKEALCETSQVFEKCHKSDEDITILTDDDSENNERSTDTDFDCLIVDDRYEKKGRNFDISCIANRTRKRKSLKTNKENLQTIDEIADFSSDSSNNFNWSKNNLRRRCKQRIYSTDDEKINKETPSTLSNAALSSSNSKMKKSSCLWLEKLPQHNYTAFLKSSRPNAR